MSETDRDWGWNETPPVKHKETRTPREIHVDRETALACAIASGAGDIPLICSYLVTCTDRADCERSIASLRVNQSHLFPATTNVLRKTFIRPLRGNKR